MADKKKPAKKQVLPASGYDSMLSGVVELLEQARRTSVRAVNAIMTATYWEIGRRIVEFEQGGNNKADYGKQLMDRLAADLTSKLGRGFGRSNLFQMRQFYITYSNLLHTLVVKPDNPIVQTTSGQLADNKNLICFTLSGKSSQTVSEISAKNIAACFPLPWSHYVSLISVDNPDARRFYEEETLRGGWSVRQLNRKILTLFYERTANQRAVFISGAVTLSTRASTNDMESRLFIVV